MSNNAMSNETDLYWLARNEHYWPEGAVYVSRHENAVKWHYVELAFKGLGHFTKDQWLSRRAELQNKPSWEGAPEWAGLLAQDDSGEWYWYAAKPTHPGMKSWWPAPGAKNAQCGKGEVLGDWRDTLERRSEEFKQFTSIEDSQEQGMTNHQEMKQDNKWFERGELPPVGVECEAKKYGKEEWYKVVICGAGKHRGLAVAFYEKQKGSGAFTCSSAEYFRPIRTERDVLLSIIVEEMNRYDTDGKLADSILAAGFSLRDK